jgi:hypothetical protein
MIKDNYYDKYLKYKTKYHELKQIVGGVPGSSSGSVPGSSSGSVPGSIPKDVPVFIMDQDDGDMINSESPNLNATYKPSDIETVYNANWTKLSHKKIYEKSEPDSTTILDDLRHKFAQVKSINISMCSTLDQLLDSYCKELIPDSELVTDSELTDKLKDIRNSIASYAYIMCIDDKYFIPDLLLESDTSRIFDKVKNYSDDYVSVKIIIDGLSIEYQNEFPDILSSIINNPVDFLNRIQNNMRLIILEQKHLHYVQYIALITIIFNKYRYIKNEQIYNSIKNLDDTLLTDYRLFAFLLLFNSNLLILAKIVSEDDIIKLMKNGSPTLVFDILVFSKEMKLDNGVYVPAEKTEPYTEKILKQLVNLQNRKVNKEMVKLEKSEKFESVLTKRNKKKELLNKSVTWFNTNKHKNTSMSKYEFEITNDKISDLTELKLAYKPISA